MVIINLFFNLLFDKYIEIDVVLRKGDLFAKIQETGLLVKVM